MRQKTFLLCAIIIVLLVIVSFNLLPTTSANSFIDWITGKTTNPTNISITVSAIKIPFVSEIVNPQNVTEGGALNITLYFNATIPGGLAANIDNSTAMVNFSRAGETTRQNTSCLDVSGGVDWVNFTCTVTVWYWDGAGNWTVTAYIKDTNGNGVMNTSTNMTLAESTCFTTYPSPLTWSTLIPGSTNQTSSNDPSILNNTCNKDIDASGVSIKALNLHGDTNSGYFINSTNFTVDTETGGSACSGEACIECDGSRLSNNSYSIITGANLTAGNNSLNYGNSTSGQEQLYYCLTDVESTLLSQTYSTNTLGSWTIQIL